MARRVLVTRPEPGNLNTAERFSEAGFEPVILPLTQVEPLPCGQEVPAGTEAIAITSPNALRFAPPELLSAIGELPVYAVGAASARFAESCGLNVVAEGNAGAIELAELMAKELTKGARVGYLCGKVRHPDFESRMQALGFVIKPVEIYDTIQVSYLTKSIGETLGDCPLDAVLLHSAESAAALDELLARVKPGQITDNTHYFCFSERIAAKLTSVVKSRIVISARPNDAALIVAVKKIFG